MTSTIIRPSSVASTTGAVTVTGAANAAAALDASSSSYDQFASSSGVTEVRCQLDDITLTAGHLIYGIRIKFRCDTGAGFCDFFAEVDDGTHITQLGHYRQEFTNSAVFTVTPWQFLAPSSALWTATNVNSLVLRLRDGGAGSTLPRLVEAYVEVLDHPAPTCTAIGPSGSGSTTFPLTAVWSNTFDSGMSQSKYEIKVYTFAQTIDTAFDPDVTIPVLHFGPTSGTEQFRPMGLFPDGVWVTYVRVAQQNGKYEMWSAWSSVTYTLARSPSIPIISPASGVTIDTGAGFTTSWQYHHPDPLVGEIAWALRRKTDAGAYQYWRESDDTWQSTVQFNGGSDLKRAWGPGDWPNGHVYAWSIDVQSQGPLGSGFADDHVINADTAPVVTVVGPTDPVTDTLNPTIVVDYSDAEGDLLETMMVQLFTDAQVSDPLFSPDTTTPYWSSNSSDGTTEFIEGPPELTNGSRYWAFARAFSNNQWSLWDGSPFTVTLAKPTAPTLIIETVDVVGGSLGLAGTGQTAAVTPWIDVEYSDDGVSWKPVRNGTTVTTLWLGTTPDVTDREMLPNVTRSYRARAKGFLAGTDAIVISDPSNIVTFTWRPRNMWLKDVLDSSVNTAVGVDVKFTQKRKIMSGIFYTKGTENAIVTSERKIRGREWDMMFRALSKAEEEALTSILIPGRILILCDVIGENTYFKVVTQTSRDLIHADDLTLPRRWAWAITVSAVEQDIP